MSNEDSNGKSRFPRIAGNNRMDIHAVRKQRYSEGAPVALMTHARQGVDGHAAFAMACIERWAMVAGESDGEDSRGRQRLRRMTPAELVAHACDVSEIAHHEFERRGWLVRLPSYQEALDAVKETENGND